MFDLIMEVRLIDITHPINNEDEIKGRDRENYLEMTKLIIDLFSKI